MKLKTKFWFDANDGQYYGFDLGPKTSNFKTPCYVFKVVNGVAVKFYKEDVIWSNPLTEFEFRVPKRFLYNAIRECFK